MALEEKHMKGNVVGRRRREGIGVGIVMILMNGREKGVQGKRSIY